MGDGVSEKNKYLFGFGINILSYMMMVHWDQIIIVKMMKSSVHASGGRSASNSQESTKMKKSLSSAFSNKLKSQEPPSINTMIYSIKKTRENSSKSNKKPTNQSCHSNKIFKALADITPTTNVDSTKKPILKKNQPTQPCTEKKTGTTIPVKNIKQKIVGKGMNQSTIQSSKIGNKDMVEKENEGQFNKKAKKLFGSDNNHLPGRKNTEHSDESLLLNFSCILNPYKNEELNLNMFEVGRKLGRGKFGDVYMCRDINSGFACAIKMISKSEVRAAGMEAQLMQEIKIQLYSNHPNILKMYGFFHDANKVYLLLELVTNGCLFKEIRKKNNFEENLASFYFRQVVSGVRYLHSNYIIHRDIKPENILNNFNVLKICDFGWAIYSPLYKRQTFCGTLDYVPPEIVTGQFYDQKADIWCLGVLCYQLSTGKAPFESNTDQNETYDKILKVDIQFPIYLSPQIVDFIGKILNRDPAKRMSLQDVQRHEWMKKYQNETGRMISKDIWDCWMKLSKGE